MVAVAVPEVLPLFIPVAFVFWWARRRYLRTSREVKRYEATTRSPVFASFSSILKVWVFASLCPSSRCGWMPWESSEGECALAYTAQAT